MLRDFDLADSRRGLLVDKAASLRGKRGLRFPESGTVCVLQSQMFSVIEYVRKGLDHPLSKTLRECSGPLCMSSITENICDWRTHSVPDLGKLKPNFSWRDAASSTNNPFLESTRSKSRSTAKSACVCMVNMTETCGTEILLSRSLEFVAW